MADSETDAVRRSPAQLEIRLVESGRAPGQIDTAILLFGCTHPGCETKIEHVVDVAACLAIFGAHTAAHIGQMTTERARGLFDADGQPLTARKGLLDT